MSRRKRTRYQPGEHFAKLPREVLESTAYRMVPDWAKTTVTALAGQYHGVKNGDLSLSWREALSLGVSAQWKLRAGIKLAEASGLIDVTCRGGNVAGGEKRPTLYALGWLPIEPSVKFTSPPGSTLRALNRWATWKPPVDWREQIVAERQRAQGKKKGHHTREVQTEPHGRTDSARNGYTRGERNAGKADTHGGVTSRDLPPELEIGALKLLETQPHLSDFDVAKAMEWKVDPYRVGLLRQRVSFAAAGAA